MSFMFTNSVTCFALLFNSSLMLSCIYIFLVRFMVFNATFNNISDISWRSVLLVEETGGPGENHPYMFFATYR